MTTTTASRQSTVDVHCHYVPRGWPELPGVDPQPRWIDTEREAMIMVGSREFRRIQSDSWDPAVRVADMDADGVSQQVVSPTPVFFGYERSGAEAAKISAIFNDLALAICARSEERRVGKECRS